MESKIRLVLVEDVEAEAELTVSELARAGLACTYERVETETGLRRTLEKGRPDLVISDFTLPQFDGIRALDIVRGILPDIPFIFVTGTGREIHAQEARRRGATDFLPMNRIEHLAPLVRRVLQQSSDPVT